MDEMPVCFNMVGSLTVNSKGAKTVYVQTTNNNKNRFTVVLTCLVDGTKLSLVIIFKEKVWPVNTSPPPAGVVVWFQDKSWIDEPEMQKLRKLWHGWIANSSNGLTKGRNLKCADLSTVCYWGLNTWNDIPKDIIVRAFKKCSISNCLLGSKDHLIYDDDESDSDKSDKYKEDKEFNEDYEPEKCKFDKGNEDDNSNEYNK
ncbi:36117_t:CDS:2 [Gigaspora margarita]|uniref:36117_t:CDS:1 n=1 Tax=Gigaspora margarita TaxID=4874 RepID=A0ABN7WVD3_GIGMA|nr:36117_t:CDS:2 [Gigaspora margarita]